MKYKIKYHGGYQVELTYIGTNDTLRSNSFIIDVPYIGHIRNEYQNLIVCYGFDNINDTLYGKAYSIATKAMEKYNTQDQIIQENMNGHTWSNYFCPIIWNGLRDIFVLDQAWLSYDGNWETDDDFRFIQECGDELASVPMWQEYAKFILSYDGNEPFDNNNDLELIDRSNNFIKELLRSKINENNYYDFIYIVTFSRDPEYMKPILIELMNEMQDINQQFREVLDVNNEIDWRYITEYIIAQDREGEGISKIEKYAPKIGLIIND